MNRPTTTHATHDQLLLARLYGGDVDEAERSLAVEQMATCPDCADVFADFGAISSAVVALPIPPRPRDFTLSQADAARAGRRSIGWTIFERLGRTKALGGSMVAAGMVGFAIVGALSVFGQGGGASPQFDHTVGAPVAAATAAAPAGAQGAIAANGTGTDNIVAGPSAASPAFAAATAPVPVGPATAAAPSHAAASAASAVAAFPVQIPAAIPPASSAGDKRAALGAQGAGSSTQATTQPLASGVSAPPNGPDPRDIILAAFAALALLGLLLLAAPLLVRRRARR
jgi:hypothetical protein